MATFTAIKNRGGGSGALGGVLHYVQQEEKTTWEDRRLVSGWNCTSQSVYDEMRLTKEQFDKTDGRQYYHFVQSFDKQDDLSPQEVHIMGLELAQREFPNFEVLVATHVDTEHFHNHLVVNSVSFQDGKKLHQSAADLQAHRIANDEICAAHGLEILPPPQKQVKQKRMSTREYRSAAKGESWKFRLMNTIDQCMRYAATREEFISLMESEGYEVHWTENRKNMHFNRAGIDKIYEVVEAGLIEAIVVKDLSRLGRHRTQTALFIDYLREHNVRVLSATENIDTLNEADDLIIGFKGLVNDFYARDGSRRVRTGYRQKQKEGIVMIPPFGYFKDKNTKQVVIVEEAAETVRMIFTAYIGGHGLKAIAKMLNEQKRKTPALTQLGLLNKHTPNTQDGIIKKYLWDGRMVGRILQDESYIGTLICHKSERNKINKTFRFTEAEEQFRHENFFPPIVSREIWEQAQVLLAERKERNVRAGANQSILRYGGLLRCEDCGRSFVEKRIHAKSGERVEYSCDTYHRYGKEYCSSHTVDERILDELITKELMQTKAMYEENFQAMEHLIDQWQPKASAATTQIKKQKERIAMLEEEMEAILMERIRDKANAERYDRMIQKREAEIAAAQKQIEELQNIEETLRNRQAKLKRDISMMDDILKEGHLSEAHLRLLVDKIYVHEEDGKLSLDICLKAPFRDHLDIYENGEQTECWVPHSYGFELLDDIIPNNLHENE